MGKRQTDIGSIIFLFIYFTFCNWAASYLLQGWRNVLSGLGEYRTFRGGAFVFLIFYLLILSIFFTAKITKDWARFKKYGWLFFLVILLVRFLLDTLFLFYLGQKEKWILGDLLLSNVTEITYYLCLYALMFLFLGERRFSWRSIRTWWRRVSVFIVIAVAEAFIYLKTMKNIYGAYDIGVVFRHEELDFLLQNMRLVAMVLNEWCQCIMGTCLFFLFKYTTTPKKAQQSTHFVASNE